MIRHSDTISTVVAALGQVQRAVGHVEKNSKNPHFGNTYADLNTFLHALADPIADAGLTLMQGPSHRDGWVTVDTMIVHEESGEWIASEAGSPMPKADPQGAGSVITYLRRYSLASLFALPQEDDDGNAASGRNGGVQPAPQERQERTEGTCPRCESPVWDNRAKKAAGTFNPKSPDYTCRDKDGCGWALWLNTAMDEIQGRLEKLLLVGAITEAGMNNCLEGVADGDLASLRIAEGWIEDREREAS